MGDPGEAQVPTEMNGESALSRERALLRKLADDYYGLYLVRVIEGIAHNLSGPLQVLYIRAEQVEQGLEQLLSAAQSGEVTEVQKLAGRMEKKIRSISDSLDDLNDQMKHLTADLIIGRRSEIGDVEINEVAEDCLFLLNANMFFKHKVEKTLRLGDSLPVLKGRKTDFCVVILSIVQNALEALVHVQDKHINIETSRRENRVVIRIQDSGSGIREQDHKYIYDPFFTTKKGTGDNGEPDKHEGLGLALVSILIEDYKGTITCESVPGKTTFTVEIPGVDGSSNA